VILADVVGSSDVPDFRTVRDRTLREASAAHLAAGWTDRPYAITAWDEFQGIVASASATPRAVWSLRRRLHPLLLRVGIGVGPVERSEAGDRPVNVDATGDAFVRAREALEEVGRRRDPRFEPLSEIRTGDRDDDRVANAIAHLVDLLTARITDGQWRTIEAVERHGRQDRAAAELGRNESTVSRALKRASYSHILDAMDALGTVIEGAARRVGGRSTGGGA